MSITENIRVIKVYEPFILGKCACGCGEEIEIRRHYKNRLYKYKNHHALKGRKFPNTPKGINHFNYKRGFRITVHGYIEILRDENSFSKRKDIYILEHIDIYQKYYKLCMLEWGRIHHKDKNRKNNKISNLEGMMASNHIRLHNIGNKYNKKDMSNRKCLLCNSTTTYIDKSGSPKWSKYDNGFICKKCTARLSYKNKKSLLLY